MEMALYEPGLGYYVNGLHKFGAAGDFVTAPEQGRLFAAGIARQLDRVGAALGPGWTVLEAGPGSGALARDALKQMTCPPRRWLLLEPSAPLRRVQSETLRELPDELAARIEWLDAPPAESFSGAIVANEVIDALPVNVFEVAAEGLRERCVDLADGRLAWTSRPAPERLAAAVAHCLEDLPEAPAAGYIGEICPSLPGWLETVTAPLARGLALLVDYGYPRSEYYHPTRRAGTLVCHYRHRAHFDPFVWPGLTDISAFVNFTAVAEAADACGLEVAGYTSQAGFLLGMGVHELVERAEDETERLRLAGELKRLTLPGEMGEKFQVMALTRGMDLGGAGFALADRLDRL